ncbi:MAG: hypothetical protein DIU79_05250 [Actinobacteria bacterium]|nr:MAG: hypothetical protein DIU79_05250 [Actinomycetota bacterium]
MRAVTPIHRLAIATALLASSVLPAGCGTTAPGRRPAMTEAQATARLTELLYDAFAQLPPGATLQEDGDPRTSPCTHPRRGETGEVYKSASFAVNYPPGWPVDEAIPRLAEYWRQQGARLLRKDKDLGIEAYSVETREEFTLSIVIYPRENSPKDIELTGSSPCVRPNETRERGRRDGDTHR